MAKLENISLLELYDRKITSSVEKEILKKEDFNVQAASWCEKVCKLKCKNPPIGEMFKSDIVDVLIIQDYSAIDDVRFRRSGIDIEKKHRSIIDHLTKSTLAYYDDNKEKVSYTYDVTALIKCRIQDDDIVKGKAPAETVLMKCKPYLLQEIQVRKPKLIISLNTSVTKALGLKKSNYRDCGDIVEYEGIPVILTLHPRILLMLRQNSSGAAWGPDYYSIVEHDFVKAAWILNKGLKVPNLDAALERVQPQTHIARSMKDVIEFCNILTEAGLAGYIESLDTETTGLDPWAVDARLITIQFGYRNPETNLIDAYVFPLWHRHNIWYDSDEAWKLISPILINENIKKVLHNAKFDLLYIEITKGIRVRGVLFDTLLLLHAINSGVQGFYGLKSAIGYWLPDLELSGYEGKLPKLTKKGIINDESERDDEETYANGRVGSH
jgi:hypothetical protein